MAPLPGAAGAHTSVKTLGSPPKPRIFARARFFYYSAFPPPWIVGAGGSRRYVCEQTNARSRKEVAIGLFIKVGTTQELEALEAGKLVEAAGERIAVFNAGGKYWAIDDTCPHRGGPLSEGILVEDEVICP